MNLAEIQAELEEDRTWRLDEIRFLRNRLGDLRDVADQDRFRRSLIVMLYAHFEGFCKFALLRYIRAINSLSLSCDGATGALLAASWQDVFAGLDVFEQTKVFRADLPGDPKLGKLSRRREFAERIRELLAFPVTVPDSAIDLESNLSVLVLKKNLYRIGLEVDLADQWSSQIGQLLGRRNNIAHGEDREGVSNDRYAAVETAVFAVMDGVLSMVMDALRSELFRRVASPGAPAA